MTWQNNSKRERHLLLLLGGGLAGLQSAVCEKTLLQRGVRDDRHAQVPTSLQGAMPLRASVQDTVFYLLPTSYYSHTSGVRCSAQIGSKHQRPLAALQPSLFGSESVE